MTNILQDKMQAKIVYQFESAQVANRFLNDANASLDGKVKARLAKGSDTVSVTYQYSQGAFDTTSADLDDLAARYSGREV